MLVLLHLFFLTQLNLVRPIIGTSSLQVAQNIPKPAPVHVAIRAERRAHLAFISALDCGE
jgi:hypothetical protein